MNQMFSINVKMLHDALQLNTDLFIYLDRSYDCYLANNAIFQNLLSINRQMVKSYCDYFEKNYTILFLYNLIGYKLKTYQGEVNLLNHVLEHSKKLIFNSEYKYVHFVYIRDVLEIIASLVLQADNVDSRDYNKEEHIRYNNIGFDVEKMISLFEQLNSPDYVFKYKKLTIGNKVAPCHGEPSQLLSNKHINPDH
jgi:PhoPQ-activated pathogenicity-related protein